MKVKFEDNKIETRTELANRACFGLTVDSSVKAWFSVYASMEYGSGTGNAYGFTTLKQLKELRKDIGYIIKQLEVQNEV